MRFIGIIPARYASTRFPGKPLALLGGKTVIERVYRAVEGQMDYVAVATDDERIASAVRAFGGRCVLTDPRHRSGTDRCREALTKMEADLRTTEGSRFRPFDVVVNVQGDEPFIRPRQLQALTACFADPATDIATLVRPFTPADGFAALQNPNSPKVVVNARMEALYFSRSVIPFLRETEAGDAWLSAHTFYKHIGLYAYRAPVLTAITQLPSSPLERAESLEQLRWLENGYRIRCAITHEETIGIDTPADLARAEVYLQQEERP